MVPPFAAAVTSMQPGERSQAPVQTQFGWHVIYVEDVRPAKVPTFDEVKPQLVQRMQPQYLDKYFKELRAKNGV
jgi:peptidyl-prolyl cis-trans isomerase C